MPITASKKSIVAHGTKQVLVVFFLLLFLILFTTSFFILKPFVQVTANTVTSFMVKTLDGTNKTTNNISRVDLSDSNNYLVKQFKYKKQILSLPFLYFVKAELEERLKSPVDIIKPIRSKTPSHYYWFHINNSNQIIGFKKQLIGTRPELTMFILLSVLLLISGYLSFTISKKLNAPLLLLKNITQQLSQGDFSAKLPPHEIVEINQAFEQVNSLIFHFKHLLEQRVIFLSGISHDIRTPITRLKLLIAINEDKLSPEFIKKSNHSLKEMQALIKLYLDSSEYLLKSVNNNVIINHLLTSITEEYNEDIKKLIQIESNFNHPIRINETALKRVINNLLHNSIKYASPKKYGTISIQTRRKNESLWIEILDQGKGIKNKELEEVFKPFFRSEDQKDIQGNGLGLSITRQICLSQGWIIQLSNKPNNTGLMAQLQIPTGTF